MSTFHLMVLFVCPQHELKRLQAASKKRQERGEWLKEQGLVVGAIVRYYPPKRRRSKKRAIGAKSFYSARVVSFVGEVEANVCWLEQGPVPSQSKGVTTKVSLDHVYATDPVPNQVEPAMQIEEGNDLDLVVLLPSSNAVDEAVDFVIEINI